MGARVLIVDDDTDLRDALSDVLEDEGIAVATAADGIAALEYLRANEPPCLILLDYMMPRCNGVQFRVQQQQDPQLAGIPVVLLTADARREQKSAEISVDEFIAKPVSREQLCTIVRKYCPG